MSSFGLHVLFLFLKGDENIHWFIFYFYIINAETSLKVHQPCIDCVVSDPWLRQVRGWTMSKVWRSRKHSQLHTRQRSARSPTPRKECCTRQTSMGAWRRARFASFHFCIRVSYLTVNMFITVISELYGAMINHESIHMLTVTLNTLINIFCFRRCALQVIPFGSTCNT